MIHLFMTGVYCLAGIYIAGFVANLAFVAIGVVIAIIKGDKIS